jgi:hypothetical protein
MKRRMADLVDDSLEALEDIIIDIWNSVTEQELLNLVGSMEKRLEACIKEGGGPNGY